MVCTLVVPIGVRPQKVVQTAAVPKPKRGGIAGMLSPLLTDQFEIKSTGLSKVKPAIESKNDPKE